MSLGETQTRTRRLLNMLELVDFVKWAFGPDGLPNLQIVAFGDFSIRERFGWTQVLFVRYPRPGICVSGAKVDESGVFGPSLPFRFMHPEDEYLWDEIEGSRELLEACPQALGVEDTIIMNQEGYDGSQQESYFSDSDIEYDGENEG